jgi:hypothetical protein
MKCGRSIAQAGLRDKPGRQIASGPLAGHGPPAEFKGFMTR